GCPEPFRAVELCLSREVMLSEKKDVRPKAAVPTNVTECFRAMVCRDGRVLWTETRKGKMRKLTLILGAALLLALALSWSLQAQELVAHIRGTITDPSGAGVPGAEVKATNTQTQVSATVPSKDDGS